MSELTAKVGKWTRLAVADSSRKMLVDPGSGRKVPEVTGGFLKVFCFRWNPEGC